MEWSLSSRSWFPWSRYWCDPCRRDKNGTSVTALTMFPTVVAPSTSKDSVISSGRKDKLKQARQPLKEGDWPGSSSDLCGWRAYRKRLSREKELYRFNMLGAVTRCTGSRLCWNRQRRLLWSVRIFMAMPLTTTYTPTVWEVTDEDTTAQVSRSAADRQPLFGRESWTQHSTNFRGWKHRKGVQGSKYIYIAPDGTVTFVPKLALSVKLMAWQWFAKNRNGQTILSSLYIPASWQKSLLYQSGVKLHQHHRLLLRARMQISS